MRLLLLSGIFGQTAEYRATHLAETPDSLLADGLAARGVDVTTAAPTFWGPRRPYDLVHLHHVTNACVRALAPGGPKLVFTPHTSGRLPWKHEAVRRSVELRSDAVVVFTDDERGKLGSHVTRDKVEVIRSGLAVERFTSTLHRAPRGDEPWEFLYVGQLIPCKRVHLALELLRRVLATGRRARLRIVSHRETLRPQLEEEARRLGVAGHVEYVGTRTRDEMSAEMARAHVLLLPSDREAFSTVTSEAAVCGLPVMLFDVAGTVEQVPMGWERPAPADVETWMRLSLRRLDDYQREAARWYAFAPVMRERLSTDRVVREHLSLYERVLRG